MSQSVGVDTNRTVNPRIRLNSADSIISEDATANKDSNPENRFDDLADQIINTFIVKKQERLIDREEHKENISYEASEIRLIYLGIFSASFLGMVSLVLTILFGLQALSTTQVIILNVPKPKDGRKRRTRTTEAEPERVARRNARSDWNILYYTMSLSSKQFQGGYKSCKS